MSDQLRKKLKGIEDNLSSLRTDRATKAQAVESAKAAYADSDEQGQSGPLFKAAQEALKARGEIDDQINDLQGAQVGVLKMLGQDNESEDRAIEKAVEGSEDPERAAWNVKRLFEGDIADRLKALSSSAGRFGSIDLGSVVDRDALKADIAGTTNSRRGNFGGIAGQSRRQLRVLDLIPTATTNGNSVPYVQEGGTYAAAETAESAAKPEDGQTLTDATADVQTIAAWQKIRKQTLSDIPALQGIVDTRLRYSVLRRLEGQVVTGNGTGVNIRGILSTSGIGTVAFTAIPQADLILSGITQVLLGENEADGIVVHPSDWQTILAAKTSGSGEYLSGGPFTTVQPTLWGVPLIPSPVMTQGFALVGDFAMGATLFIREGVNVLLSDSDQDDFIKNRVTMLGEMRAALAVWRPAAFSNVDIVTP